MAGKFDPYHSWLGIPPDEQPPNHYRLLGVRLFEDHRDAIENATDARMHLLRSFQIGKHGDLSQRLLNEVAAARLCLLSPAKRQAYDAQLRAMLQPVPPSASGPAPPPRAPIAPAAPVEESYSSLAAILQEETHKPGLSGKHTKSGIGVAAPPKATRQPVALPASTAASRLRPPQIAIIGLGALMLLCIGLLTWICTHGGDSEISAEQSQKKDGGKNKHGGKDKSSAVSTTQTASVAKTKQTRIVFHWPATDRKDAELRIGGDVVAVPKESDSKDLEFPAESGLQTIEIWRPGYEKIKESRCIVDGETFDFRPEWVKEPVGVGLRGQYFQGRNLDKKVLERADPSIEFWWNTDSPAPGLSSQDYSVRWSGWLRPPKPGRYQFIMAFDDYGQLAIDGKVVFSRVRFEPACGKAEVELTGKPTRIEVQMTQTAGPAYAVLRWKRPDSPTDEVIPGAFLFQDWQTANTTDTSSIAPPDARTTDDTSDPTGLVAEYLDGKDRILKKRIDRYLDWCWGTDRPEPDMTDWRRCRWTGFLSPPAAGAYQLAVVHAGALRLSLNGKRLFDEPSAKGNEVRCEVISAELTASPAPLEIDYQPKIDASCNVVSLQWIPPDGKTAVLVPATALSHGAPGKSDKLRGKSWPVPEKAIQDRLAKLVAETYKTAAADSPEDKSELAGKLLDEGQAMASPDAAAKAEQYARLREAARLAASAGDAELALEAVAAIAAAGFEIDRYKVQGRLMTQIAEKAVSQGEDVWIPLLVTCRHYAAQAIAAGAVEVALETLASARGAAQKTREKLRTKLTTRRAQGGREEIKVLEDKIRELSAIEKRVAAEWESLQPAQPDVAIDGEARSRMTKKLAEIARLVDGNSEDSDRAALPMNIWIDLLALADLTKDVSEGQWKREETAVRSSRSSRLHFPVFVHGGYDLEIEFTKDGDGFWTMLPVGERTIGALFGNEGFGVESIDRGTWHENETSQPTVRLQNREVHKILYKMRIAGENGRLDIELDGKPMTQWKGKLDRLHGRRQWGTFYCWQPAIHVNSCTVELRSVRLRSIRGEGSYLAQGRFPDRFELTPHKGGNGGWRVMSVASNGYQLAGFRLSENDDLRGIQPIYRKLAKTRLGAAYGKMSGKLTEAEAKPGYVVGAIVLRTSDKVHAMKVTFVRSRGNQLDWKDTYDSPLIGSTRGQEASLGGPGKEVVGIHGGDHADRIESLGLVLTRKEEP